MTYGLSIQKSVHDVQLRSEVEGDLRSGNLVVVNHGHMKLAKACI